MSLNIYLNLLILCGILCQGVMGSFLEEEESSDLLVRKKRVINYEPHRQKTVSIQNYGYIVSILTNGQIHCVGAILSHRIVITAAKCAVFEVIDYKVIAGTARFSNDYKIYNVTTKRILLSNDIHRPTDGIALFVVDRNFEFSRSVRIIHLYRLPVEPGTLATVTGWGGTPEEHQPGCVGPRILKSITVPIISNQECANAYRQFFPITDKDICTHDTSGQQYCGVTDQGAPLVVKKENRVYYLIGINLWGGSLSGYNRPDIYVNLKDPHYANWLERQMPQF